jgi:hypothetical protein
MERLLFMSGVGGGKTFILANKALKYIKKFPHMIGFIGANTYSQLSKSTLKRCFDVWQKDHGMINGIHFVVDKIPPAHWPKVHVKLKSYENTISFNNGALVFTASLDNYKVIDGTEFGWAALDETKDTKEEAVKEVIVARLRQSGMYVTPKGELVSYETEVSHNPLWIFTSPAKVLWLNEWFGMPAFYDEIVQKIYSKETYFLREEGRQCLVICSTFHNEENLPSGYIDGLKADYAGNPHLVDMLIYGSPIAKSGGEFYHQFNRMTHIKKCELKREWALHFGYDFNVVPYITGLCCQIEWDDYLQKYFVRFLKGYPIEAPRNNSEDLSNIMLMDYLGHKAGVYIYGDASGKNRQTVSKEFKHNYQVIEYVLKPILAGDFNRVMRKNPPLIKRRDFVNKMLAGGYEDIVIEIDPACKELITDLEFCKEGPDGGKRKEMVKDSNTGESYQKLGHFGDAFEYILCKAFENYFSPK